MRRMVDPNRCWRDLAHRDDVVAILTSVSSGLSGAGRTDRAVGHKTLPLIEKGFVEALVSLNVGPQVRSGTGGQAQKSGGDTISAEKRPGDLFRAGGRHRIVSGRECACDPKECRRWSGIVR
jgi:hypothetical protein